MRLRVLVDHTIVETFVARGRVVLTSRDWPVLLVLFCTRITACFILIELRQAHVSYPDYHMLLLTPRCRPLVGETKIHLGTMSGATLNDVRVDAMGCGLLRNPKAQDR